MRFLFFIIVCLFKVSFLYSQNLDYRKSKKGWVEFDDYNKEVKDTFSKCDAVYLYESHNLQPQLKIGSTIIKKQFAVKIINNSALPFFARINLPEFNNEFLGEKESKYWLKKKTLSPLNYEYEIIYFKARIIKPEGKIIECAIKDTYIDWPVSLNDESNTVHFYEYVFPLVDIEVGDIIEYQYEAIVPITNVSSPLIVFPAKRFPIQEYIFSVLNSYDSRTFKYIISNMSKSQYDSLNVYKNGDLFCNNRWRFNNIGGYQLTECLYSINAFPTIKLAVSSNFSNVDRYNFITVQVKEKDRDYFLGKKDKHTLGVNKFYNQHVSMLESNSLNKFITIHNELNKLNYLYDSTVYKVAYRPHISAGEYLTNKIFRQIKFDDYYEALFNRTNTQYYKVLILDKRIGQITYDFDASQANKDLLYVYKDSNDLKHYFFPNQTGYSKYFVDEIPFYYEGTPSIFMTRNIPNDKFIYSPTSYDYTKGVYYGNPNNLKEPLPIDTMIVSDSLSVDTIYSRRNFSSIEILPTSNNSENTRVNNFLVELSQDYSLLNYTFRVSLSGQFSTILRNFFTEGLKDYTISKKYYDYFFVVPKQKINYKTISINSGFPFKSVFSHSFSANNISNENNFIKIKMDNWFSFIHYPLINPYKRQIAYAIDFKHKDKFIYQIKSPTKVKCTNCLELGGKINNTFADLSFNFLQMDDYTISVEATLNCNNNITLNIFDVTSVFKKIDEINNASLILEKLE